MLTLSLTPKLTLPLLLTPRLTLPLLLTPKLTLPLLLTPRLTLLLMLTLRLTLAMPCTLRLATRACIIFPDCIGVFSGSFDDPNWFPRNPDTVGYFFASEAPRGMMIPAGFDTYTGHAKALDGSMNHAMRHAEPFMVGHPDGTKESPES